MMQTKQVQILAGAYLCAGDVNGDGYSDVIIGAAGYDDGANTNEGRAFILWLCKWIIYSA
ncbi:MAG: FG-GAP repeat protein [Chitinophagaceae bacterium]|nr:FG-GAP repeat protein [Chitinophagaceae bacterium]